MKLVRENINEKFSDQSDPIADMNIGTLNHIKEDMKKIGYTETDYDVMDDYTIVLHNRRWKNEQTAEIQLKYMPEEKSLFVTSILDLQHRSASHPNIQAGKDQSEEMEEYVQEAIDNGISDKEIVRLMKEFGTDNQIRQLTITLAKLTRPKKEIKFQNEYNRYVFIGYTDKVPVVVNGKKYFEDKFKCEKMMKIDRYNKGDMSNIFMMKIRADAQYKHSGHQGESGVYMVDIPKDMMDEKYYNEIPEEYRYIIEKYKKKI